MITFSRVGRSAAAMAIARMRLGNAMNISVSRMSRSSVRPRKYPETIPSGTPIAVAITAARSAIRSDTREP
jgi:hypothetical protein